MLSMNSLIHIQHESHYARRDSSSKRIFLPSHLTVNKMYKEYLEMRVKNGHDKSACYDVFRKTFNTTGYKFKQLYIVHAKLVMHLMLVRGPLQINKTVMQLTTATNHMF